MLAKRLALCMMLEQHLPSSTIQAVLNLSRETVRIYQQQFPLKSKAFHATIFHLLRLRKIKEFFQQAEKIAYTLLTAKTNMKSRTRLISGNWR